MLLSYSQLEITYLRYLLPPRFTRLMKGRLPRGLSSFLGPLVPGFRQFFQQSPGDLLVLGRFQERLEVQKRYGGAAEQTGCFPRRKGEMIRLPEERGAFAVRCNDAERVQSFDQDEQGLLVKVAGYDARARFASVSKGRQGAVQRFRRCFRKRLGTDGAA